MLYLMANAALAQSLTIGPLGDYPTVEAALQEVPEAEELLLSAGDHPLRQLIRDQRQLTIRGMGADQTSVTSPSGEVLVLFDQANVTLTDLTITASGNTGTLYLNTGGAPRLTLVDVVLEAGVGYNSSIGRIGGAITAYEGTVSLTRTQVFPTHGLQLDTGGLLYLSDSTFDAQESVLEGGRAVRGGAVYAIGSSVTLTNSQVNNNLATTGGGLQLLSTSFVDSGSTFDGNQVEPRVEPVLEDRGAALYVVDSPQIDLTSSTFTGNLSKSSSTLYFLDSLAHLDGVRVSSNESVNGVAGLATTNGSITLQDSHFLNNQGGDASVAAVELSSEAILRGNTLCANNARFGAVGLFGVGPHLAVGNLFRDNVGEANTSDHVYIDAASNPRLENNHFVGGLHPTLNVAGTVELVNNVFANGPGDVVSGVGTVSGGFNAIVAPADSGFPLANDRVSLTASPVAFTSPTCDGLPLPVDDALLIDAGDPNLLDPDASRSDLGAWGGAGAAFWDLDADGVNGDLDCDDRDPTRSPNLDELPADGIDNDCDGVDGVVVEPPDETTAFPSAAICGTFAPRALWTWPFSRRR